MSLQRFRYEEEKYDSNVACWTSVEPPQTDLCAANRTVSQSYSLLCMYQLFIGYPKDCNSVGIITPIYTTPHPSRWGSASSSPPESRISQKCISWTCYSSELSFATVWRMPANLPSSQFPPHLPAASADRTAQPQTTVIVKISVNMLAYLTNYLSTSLDINTAKCMYCNK
jgi:hypothetical protein